MSTRPRSTGSRKDRRGQFAAIFALALPPLMGSVAFGVDYGMVTVAQLQSQAVADAAALAATTTMDDPSRGLEIAKAYAERMSINGVNIEIDAVEYGIWDASSRTFTPARRGSNAVRVITSAEVPTSFAGIFDIDAFDVRAEAGAGPKVVPNRAPDTVVVLDTTMSMSWSEIRAEREAAQALFDCVYERSSPESRVSVVLFGGVDTVVLGMTEYGSQWHRIQASVNQIQRCSTRSAANPCSNTNPASGYEAALQILAGADTPDDVGQAIVFMSDGEPIVYQDICSPTYRNNGRRGMYTFPLEERCAEVGGYGNIRSHHLDDWAYRAQGWATDRDVDVYTTFYGTDNRGSDWLAEHVTANDGSHHRALRADQIADTFVDICVEFTGSSAGMLF